VVREHDRFPGATLTFSAPDTDQSLTIRSQANTWWDYGAGATLGSEVIITANGLFFHVPGQTSAIAGHETVRATVDRFDENGVPVNDEGSEQINFVGHMPEEDFGAAICTALNT
jgi:hypothetical protein